jgi:oxygen-independent coproporphyrinogen-3 oxidase
VQLPSEDFVAARYRNLVPFLESQGLLQYEISNFARAGFQSIHNLKYWTRQPYLGFGVSSHSFDGARRWSNSRSLQRYMEKLEAGNFEGENRTSVTESEAAREQLFLGLRLRRGVPAELVDTLFEKNLPLQQRWDAFIGEGWIEKSNDSYRFTVEGFLVSNSILGELI